MLSLWGRGEDSKNPKASLILLFFYFLNLTSDNKPFICQTTWRGHAWVLSVGKQVNNITKASQNRGGLIPLFTGPTELEKAKFSIWENNEEKFRVKRRSLNSNRTKKKKSWWGGRANGCNNNNRTQSSMISNLTLVIQLRFEKLFFSGSGGTLWGFNLSLCDRCFILLHSWKQSAITARNHQTRVWKREEKYFLNKKPSCQVVCW